MATTISSIAQANLKMRWQEPYVSSAFNRMMTGFSAGVVKGLIPTAVAGTDPTLRLVVDPDSGTSVARFRHPDGVYAPTYFNTSSVDLDLTAFAGTRVYVALGITYTEGVATSGTFTGFTEAEYRAGTADSSLVVCYVDVPGSGALSATDIHSAVVEYADDEDWYSKARKHGAVIQPEVSPASLLAMAATTLTASISALAPEVGESYSLAYVASTDDAWIPVGIVPAQEADTIEVLCFKSESNATATGVGARVVFSTGSALISTTETYFDETAPTSATTSWHRAGASFVAPATTKWAIIYLGVADLSQGTVYFSGPKIASSAPHALNGAVHPAALLALNLTGVDVSLPGASVYLDNSLTPVLMVETPGDTEFSGAVRASGFEPVGMTSGSKWYGGAIGANGDFTFRDTSWVVTSSYVAHNPSLFETRVATFRVPLPPGCTLTAVRLISSEHAGDATANATLNLYRVAITAGVAGATLVDTASVLGTGTPATLSTLTLTVSEAYDATRDLVLEIISSGSAADARRYYGIEFDWTVQEVKP